MSIGFINVHTAVGDDRLRTSAAGPTKSLARRPTS
jgi:hypothetical protein